MGRGFLSKAGSDAPNVLTTNSLLVSKLATYLRGKDVESGGFSADRRDAQFNILKESQAEVLDLSH